MSTIFLSLCQVYPTSQYKNEFNIFVSLGPHLTYKNNKIPVNLTFDKFNAPNKKFEIQKQSRHVDILTIDLRIWRSHVIFW